MENPHELKFLKNLIANPHIDDSNYYTITLDISDYYIQNAFIGKDYDQQIQFEIVTL